uniref:Bm11755 n=1 Tax=Brugia malayi TaxID=6279 RepID=A0A1I9G9R4_BRUMA|nr:Bm11755 [Brugia malayi]
MQSVTEASTEISDPSVRARQYMQELPGTWAQGTRQAVSRNGWREAMRATNGSDTGTDIPSKLKLTS